ncbi:hypothetical protein [Halomonas sp. C05BenzN]|uniref:hypothetical protein n=1 Tax=Halomonas sp. C05BenzN TaxID=3411041 RepID=UPI003B925E99
MDRAERIRRSVDLEFQSLDRAERRRERRRLERRAPTRDEFDGRRFERRGFRHADPERRFESPHP